MGLFNSARKKSYNNGWYYGEFNSIGDRHGYGEYYWNYGDWYKGEWFYDVRTGRGEYHFKNGEVYIGQFRDDKRNGFGEYHYANGNRYVGNYVNNDKVGDGTFYYADGSKIIGVFARGEPAYGTLYWPNGEYCKGYFINWHLHGECYYTKNGVTYKVLYDNGKFIRYL